MIRRKHEKILENPFVIKTPVVRNGKQSTLGYQPEVWKGWRKMPRQQIYDMPFGKVYDCLIAKAERKGRTKDEVDELTKWLTGYDDDDIAAAYDILGVRYH